MESFSLFPVLPLELRRMIWSAALPDTDPAVACGWGPQNRFWQRRKGIPGKNEPHEDQSLRRFTSSRLPKIWLELPTQLQFVNREAREVALRWARKDNITIPTNPADSVGKCLAQREVDLERDALFLSTPDLINLMRWAQYARLGSLLPGAMGVVVDHTVKHLVVTEDWLNGNWQQMIYIFDRVVKISILSLDDPLGIATPPWAPVRSVRLHQRVRWSPPSVPERWELDETNSTLAATYGATHGLQLVSRDGEDSGHWHFEQMLRNAFVISGNQSQIRPFREDMPPVNVYRGARLRVQKF